MRFDTPVFFQKVTPGPYDKKTGNYGEDTIAEDLVFASVTDTGTEAIKILYGSIKQGVKTIRLQNHYTKPFDKIRIGDTVYNMDFSRVLRNKQTFIISEVQGNAKIHSTGA